MRALTSDRPAWPWRVGRRIEAPLAVDVLLLAGWLALRILDAQELARAWLAVGALVAIVYPATGLFLLPMALVFPSGFPLAGTMTLVMATILGWVLWSLRGRRPPPELAAVIVTCCGMTLVLGLALWHTVVGFPADVVAAAAPRWLELVAVLLLLPVVLAVRAAGSDRFLVAGVVAISVAMVVALAEYLDPAFLDGTPLAWMAGSGESARATGPLPSPNRLGTMSAMVVAATLPMLTRAGIARSAASALALVGTVVLVLTFSRGAILGVVVAVGVVLARRRPRLLVPYIATAVVLAAVVAPAFIGARLGDVGVGGSPVLADQDLGRIEAWIAAGRMILDEPVFGHGFATFRAVGPSFGADGSLLTAHNQLLGLWAEAGVVAAAAYIALLGALLHLARGFAAPYADAAVGAIVVFAVATSFNVQLWYLPVATTLWVIVAWGLPGRDPALVVTERAMGPSGSVVPQGRSGR